MKKIFLPIIICFLITCLSIFVIFNNKISENNNSNDFEIKYVDSFGHETTINSVPNKIVSLSPNTTEIICSLGIESKLVGRTDYCDFPESVKNISSVGTITEPNLESIVNLNPDIIITDGMQSEAFITSLRNLGYPVIITRANNSLQGTFDIISDIGLVTNTSDVASNLVSSMKNDLEKIKNATTAIQDKKTVYYSISLSDEALYTAGADTYINELLEIAGLINIASDSTGWTYSIENLINGNPDYIICSNMYDSKKQILEFSQISNLDAIKKENIIEIDSNIFDRQTVRNIDGIKYLISTIYNIDIK